MSRPAGIRLARVLDIIVSLAFALGAFAWALPLQAQDFQVISILPIDWFASQLTADQAGNLYGVTSTSGGDTDSETCDNGCGAVFELYQHNSQWILTTLYTFLGVADGFNPAGQLTFGPDGLYGTTIRGGFWGFGTVYRLAPLCETVCNGWLPWKHIVLYDFKEGNCNTRCDGQYPVTSVLFDHARNLYGTTEYGGFGDNGASWGTLYRLSPRSLRGKKWEETQLHIFGKTNSDGTLPRGAVLMDKSGNLYGTTLRGGDNNFGTVYELIDTGNGYSEVVLHSFNYNDGAYPQSGLVVDSSGNLYGTTSDGVSGGTVFELSPEGNRWTYKVVHNFQPGEASLLENLAIDAAGNLYGVGYAGGSLDLGTIYKLTPTKNDWVYTSLHDFTGDLDGEYPESLYLDSRGNLYGSAHCNTSCESSLIWTIRPN